VSHDSFYVPIGWLGRARKSRAVWAGIALKAMDKPMAKLAAAFAVAMDDPEFAATVLGLRHEWPTATQTTLNVEGAAAFLHLPLTTVRRNAREGRLPAFKAARQWLFFREDLERALRGNTLAA
jgi:excisionase family DNA binding protein